MSRIKKKLRESEEGIAKFEAAKAEAVKRKKARMEREEVKKKKKDDMDGENMD